jgi:metal-sulfur cluster biosynthetic enzyme
MNDNTTVPSIEALCEAFARVFDPEFGVSVQDLGLIYGIEIDGRRVDVTMTLTSFYCPAGDVILAGVKSAAEALPGVHEARVELVWEPTWTPDRLSPAAREQLGWDASDVEA